MHAPGGRPDSQLELLYIIYNLGCPGKIKAWASAQAGAGI